MYQMQKLSVISTSFREEDGFIPVNLVHKMQYSFMLFCSTIVYLMMYTTYSSKDLKKPT